MFFESGSIDPNDWSVAKWVRAIDRTSKLVFVRLVERTRMTTAQTFLEALTLH